ncbi:MAG: sigma-54 dependent transcriptional regulator [Planctomycetota bacterium]
MKPHPIIEALCNAELDALDAIVQSSSLEDPLTPYLKAIQGARFVPIGEETDAAVWKALNTPPPDPEIFQLMLVIGVRLAIRMARLEEAHRLFRIMENQDSSISSVYLKAYRLLTESDYWRAVGDSQSRQDVLDKALATDLPEKNYLWLRIKLERARSAMGNNKYATTESDLQEVETVMGESFPKHPLYPQYCFCRADLYRRSGKTQEGLIWIGRTSYTPQDFFPVRYCLLELLCQNEDWEAISELIQNPKDKLTLPPSEQEYFLSRMAFAQGKPEEAIAHARRVIAHLKNPVPVQLLPPLHVMLVAELARGNASVARLILRTMDVDNRLHYLTMERVRLALLEKNTAAAAAELRKFLDRHTPEQIREELRNAPEVSAYRFEKLKELAVVLPQTDTTSAPDTSPSPEPVFSTTLLGDNTAIRGAKTLIEKYAPLDTTVLVTGETGTGKDVVARLIHETSRCAEHPFVPVNCASIADTLMEAELFGYVKGAFTGAASDHDGLFITAGKGTLFLDDVESMPARLQAVLLRVLESGEIRPVGGTHIRKTTARIIAATNIPLEELIGKGTFREDLFYRLARFEIKLPALRERKDDIPLLAKHFLNKIYASHPDGPPEPGKDLLQALEQHRWPGNVRELENEIQRIAILAGDRRVLGADLFQPGASILSPASTPGNPGIRSSTLRRRERLRTIFREHPRLMFQEIVETLGCARATALSDLNDLEREKFIRRVQRSGGTRTRYYTRTK